MSDEIYNETAYLEDRRLIQLAANRGRLVVFVGSGTSISAGMPSWGYAVGKIKEHFEISISESDFLKIPQYYYNEYGKNSYVDLMRRIFKYGKILYPRGVHYKILKFPAKYIVTTNYDHLLEQALTDENQVFDVVSQDKDLAYGTADRKLIKMHGDFEHDNFVLKEDDYLHYSHSFRLIETYIKALIAENVVLFLGYSFSDPDLKQIFAWVKEVIGDDRPQSYIVEVGENYSVAKTNYFKNFGIKILYASEKLRIFNPGKKEENLERMIDFLQSNSDVEHKQKLDILYNVLSPLMSLNYVYGDYIVEAFAKCGIRFDSDTQIMSNYILKASADEYEEVDNLLQEICLSANDSSKISDLKKQKKLSKIIEILNKSRFKKFYVRIADENGEDAQKKIEMPISHDSEVEKICTAILNYDVKILRKLREENFAYLEDSKPQFYFRQAFIEYLLSDYGSAYANFKKATVSYYRNEVQDWYFLSILNCKLLSDIVSRYAFGNSEVERIKSDVDKLNYDQTLQTLQKPGSDRGKYLRDLCTFHLFYRCFPEIYKKALKVKEDANTAYLFHAGPLRFESLGHQVKDLWYYITGNLLLVDRYEECADIFKIYGKSIFESVMSPDIEGDYRFGFMEGVANIRPESLQTFDLYVITRYLPLKDMERIILKSKRKVIPFDSDGKKYLKTIIPNLKFWDRFIYGELFWKIVYIVVHIEFDRDLVLAILYELGSHEKYHSPYDVAVNWNQIAILFQHVIEQNAISIENGDEFFIALSNFLKFVFENFKSITSEGRRGKQNIQNVLYTVIKLQNKIQKKDFAGAGLENILCPENVETLSIIYPLLDSDCKNKIKDVVKSIRLEINDSNFHDIYLLAQNKIISIDDELEQNILDYIGKISDDRKETYPSRYELALQCVGNLYTGELLPHKQNFESFIKKSGDEFWKFIIDIQNFDMKKFQLNWINYFSKGFLNDLQKNKAVVQTIRQQVTQKYLEGWLDDNTMRRYFEFFSCDSDVE